MAFELTKVWREGLTCHQCGKMMTKGDAAVRAVPSEGRENVRREDAVWCFQCATPLPK